jgi:DNA-binding response OmpR family regulator
MVTVLVAEDDTEVRDLIVFTLEDAGYHVTTAIDGASALASAEQTRPDLVLLDVAMPEASGLEVCRALRKQPETAATPIIFLTARARWLDVNAGFDSGADDYLVKPFSPQELVHRIGTLLDQTGAGPVG